MMYPLVGLLFDRAFLATSWRQLIRQRGWLHLLCFVMVGIYSVAMFDRAPFYVERAGAASDRTTSWEYLRTQPGVLLHYVKLVFWPKELCLVYGWPVATSVGEIYGKGAVIVALLATSFFTYWKYPKVGFLGVSAFLVLAPTSTVVPLHLAFEHRMYLPLASIVVGVSLAVGWLVHRCSSETAFRRRAVLAIVFLGLAIALPLGLRTSIRNRDYWSRVQLWRATLAVRPHNPHALTNLANALEDAGRDREAIAPLDRLVREFPSYALGQHNAAVFLRKHQHLKEAEARARRATELRPDMAMYWLTLGEILAEVGKDVEARKAFDEFKRRSGGVVTNNRDA